MKVLSYNLRKHRAADEIAALVEQHDPDVLCLQEADTAALPDRVDGLVLAEATRENRLGLAVYVRESTYRVEQVHAIALKKSLHDHVLRPANERVLAATLRDIDNNTGFVVASFHAAPLTALNSLRRHQIRSALHELRVWGGGLPTLMVGDFNYPMFKERLWHFLQAEGYELVMSDSRTYTRYRMFKGYYDFAAAVGFDVASVTTLPQGSSDHLPILITATLERARGSGYSHADQAGLG